MSNAKTFDALAANTKATFEAGSDVPGSDVIGFAEIILSFDTLPEAAAAAACFAKATRAHAFECYHLEGPKTAGVRIEVDLAPSRNNGGWNEAGMRRLRSALRTLDKAGIVPAWKTTFSNSYRTREGFEAAVVNMGAKPLA